MTTSTASAPTLPLTNALSVDVEEYFQVAALSRSIPRETWGSIPSRVLKSTQRLLDMFEENGVQATFFILGWVAERHETLVREIYRRGHEVACHGFSHRLIYEQKQDVFAEETRRSKELLEDIIGASVFGYRAASYSITSKSRWALDVLVGLGFKYDSSIFPVRHDLYGISDFPRFPHILTTDQSHPLVEFPPTTVRLFGQNIPAAGGGYFRLYPYWASRWLLRRVNIRDEQPAIFYLHPWEIDPDQPRVETSLFSRFRHYRNLDACESRLRRLLADFRFGRACDVLADCGLLPATV